MSLRIHDFMDVRHRDDLLGESVTGELLEEAIDQVKGIATMLSVSWENIEPTATVKRYVRAYCYVEVCKSKAFANSPVWSADDESCKDVYANKMALYTKELEQLSHGFTVAQLTGKATSKGYVGATLHRG